MFLVFSLFFFFVFFDLFGLIHRVPNFVIEFLISSVANRTGFVEFLVDDMQM